MKQIVFLAADHAGFALKEKLKSFLEKRDFTLVDFGAFSYNKNDDYPDFVIPLAQEVAKSQKHFGIIIGGSGQGEAIAANKVKGARAVVVYFSNMKLVELTKQHNNANILSLGARFLTEKSAKKIVSLWLETKFPNEERHKRRLRKISNYENKR